MRPPAGSTRPHQSRSRANSFPGLATGPPPIRVAPSISQTETWPAPENVGITVLIEIARPNRLSDIALAAHPESFQAPTSCSRTQAKSRSGPWTDHLGLAAGRAAPVPGELGRG